MATYPVGSAETYTTIQSAVDACETATDAVGIIEIRENISEGTVTLDQAYVAEIKGISKSIVWTGNSGVQLDITSGHTISIDLRTITMSQTDTARQISWAWVTGAVLTIDHCCIDFASTAGGGAQNTIFIANNPAPSSIIITHSEIISTGTKSNAGVWLANLDSDSGNTFTFLISNTKFYGHDNGASACAIRIPSGTTTTANKTGSLINCTIDACSEGLTVSGPIVVTNCIFTNNTMDLDVTNFVLADVTYSAFEEATQALGVTNLCINQGTGIISADEYVDETTQNYHLLSTSDCRNTGTDTSGDGITDDFDGVIRPQGIAYDIGAYEFPESNGTAMLLGSNF